MPSRRPTRSARRRPATLAMKRAVSPVRTVTFAVSSSRSTPRCGCGSAAARGRETHDCECAASSSTGPARYTRSSSCAAANSQTRPPCSRRPRCWPAGEADRGTPDELDAAFARTGDVVQEGLPYVRRDKWEQETTGEAG
ncbi:hypothetical protein [Streptomyces sp. VRA16 Mangrove soil]|uniref:hypothetical protein n=1 Tax=Streptomyces sp. VRA16 Mangrove soil TaxID=2817434 RepID=UPI001E498F96|nr:hypothetical protein [Streptomyces sp. VRA16 Mangrove soil]